MKNNIKDIAQPIDTFLDSAVKTNPEDTLESVLPRIERTHKPIYVEDKDNFVGLVTLYKVMFKHFYPRGTKINQFVVRPPRINLHDRLSTICHHMLSLKCYTLPVWSDNNNPTHVIDAQSILKYILHNDNLYDNLEPLVEIQKPITYPIDASIEEVYQFLKQKNISRLILTDNDDSIAGIISRSDIMHAMIDDRSTQRFGRRQSNLKYASYFDEEKVKLRDIDIEPYVKKNIVMLQESDTLRNITQTMLDKNVSSVVLTTNKIPTGFISRHDILKGLARLEPIPEIPAIIKDVKDELNPMTKNNAYALLNNFVAQNYKRIPIKRVQVVFDTNKNKEGNINTYEIHAHIHTKDDEIIGGVTHRYFYEGLQKALKKVKRQIYDSS